MMDQVAVGVRPTGVVPFQTHGDLEMQSSIARGHLVASPEDRGERLLTQLSESLQLVCCRHTMEDVLHRILHSLPQSIGVSAAAVVLKDREDYLVVKSRVNISDRAAAALHRGIGSGVVGRLFFTDPWVVVRSDDPVQDYEDLMIGRSYRVAAAARIAAEEQTRGYLVAYWDVPASPDEVVRRYLQGLAEVCALALRRTETEEALQSLQTTDPETRLLLYRGFCRRVGEEVNRSRRYGTPFSLAVMDIDNYKEVVNTFGPAAGRELYKALADELRNRLRAIDILCALGADEFMICFPQTDAEGARIVLERFEESVRSRDFTDQGVRTSVSTGFTTCAGDREIYAMIWLAQKALHQARVSGKRLVMA